MLGQKEIFNFLMRPWLHFPHPKGNILILFRAMLWCLFVFTIAFCDYKPGVTLIPLLTTDTTSLGQKLIYPQTDSAQITIAKVIIPPGKETGWHKHLFPVTALVVQGTLTIDFNGYPSRQFAEGESFAEVIDIFHNGRNIGNKDVVLTVFFMGKKNLPLSVKQTSKSD